MQLSTPSCALAGDTIDPLQGVFPTMSNLFMKKIIVSQRASSLALGLVLAIALTAISVSGATTISTDIDTGGALTVAGAGTFNGNVTLGNAASDVIIITGNASTTNALTVGGALYAVGDASVGGYATTTASTGNIGTVGKIGAGTTSPTTLELTAQSSATTTIGAFSSGTRIGGCIQLTGTDGVLYRVYATTTASKSPLYYEPGSCK